MSASITQPTFDDARAITGDAREDEPKYFGDPHKKKIEPFLDKAALEISDASREAERKRLLAMRSELSESVRAEKDQVIAAHLRILLRDMLKTSRPPWKIGGYWPIRNEPDLRPMFHELTKGGHRIGLPFVDRALRPLTFVHWKPQSAMAPGLLGVPVPTSGNAVSVELLLVPCVGFSIGPDGVRHRLGYGGGYYDRTLASRRFKAIGVAYEAMRVENFKSGPHDVPLDYIVTEEGVR